MINIAKCYTFLEAKTQCSSKTTVALEKTPKPATKQPNPWAGFKRLSNDDIGASAKKPRKENNELPSPHICLKCGTEIRRGRDYYKKRHWIQNHPNELASKYSSMIVPKDHEKAVQRLRENETIHELHKANKNDSCQSKMTKKREMNKSIGNPVNTSTPGPTDVIPQANKETSLEESSTLLMTSSRTVQKSLASFIVTEDKPQPTPMEKMQSDINHILVMLGSLTCTEKPSQATEVGAHSDVTTLTTASSLLEIDHPDIIVDILEDGCKITCITCKNFAESQPKRKM